MDWSKQINSSDGGFDSSNKSSKRQKVSMSTPSRRPKSLFGAVMESAEKIKRKNATNTTTPLSKKHSSPIVDGGLLHLLQNVGQDFLSLPNHHHHHNNDDDNILFPNDKEEPSTATTTAATSTNKTEQMIWNEYPLYYNSTTCTLDWSLKHKCKLDYSYPSSSSQFLLPTNIMNHSSFQYWQHPSHPSSLPSNHLKSTIKTTAPTSLSRTSSIVSSSRLSSSRLSSSSTTITSTTTTTATDKNKKKEEDILIPRLISSVRSSSSRPTNNVLTFSQQLRLSSNIVPSSSTHNTKTTTTTTTTNDNNNMDANNQQQRWEWKECLYTLFYNRYWNNSSNFYFYALTKHQTILFRHSSDSEKEPMILLSSCNNTHQLSSTQFNVTLHTYNHETHKYEPYNNNHNDDIHEEKHTDENKHPLQSEVEEELEQLRRATVHGNMVGEEYFISTHSNKKKDISVQKNKDPSFLIVGEEDCLAFFEYYYNTYGGTQKLDIDDNEAKEDLPLLLYPYTFGPSSFMTLKSLSVIKKQQQQQEQNDDGVQHASIEIRGPIMPCTLQCILSYMAKQLVRHKRNNSQTNNDDNVDDDAIIQNLLKTGQGSWLSYPEDEEESDNDSQTTTTTNHNIGSHYFVCNLHTYGSNSKNKTATSTTTTTTSSAWFNDNVDNGCNHGQVIRMIVWDITRPSKLAVQTESCHSPYHPYLK